MSISLDDVSELARLLMLNEADVVLAEQDLKQKKEEARRLREDTLPCIMQELGLSELVLSTGERLIIKQDVYASIPESKKAKAYGWLEKHGHGGLVKTEITVTFGRGEEEKATKLFVKLHKANYPTALEQNVHAQTLRAFLRAELKAGTNIPLDLFGGRPVWTTKIKK